MNILAIETSCDETGIALVSGEKTKNGFAFEVLGHALLSQAALHAQYGGVYPTLAKREHQKNLPTLLEQLLAHSDASISPREHSVQRKISLPIIDAIAVTRGPGLEPALWTGINFAQKLAEEWRKPLFGVNHLEGHLISSLAKKSETPNFQSPIFKLENTAFPILGLLVSGGHTQFIENRTWFDYAIIGETLDDAVGEAFDKVARMLGLPYPGGPEISRLAESARTDAASSEKKIASFVLPRPMLRHPGCDVSFSGLKTAALYALRDLERSRSDLCSGLPKVGPLDANEKAAFAREFEDAVADIFVEKTRRALKQTNTQTFVIGGGVAANKHLRTSLVEMIRKEFSGIEIRLPDLSITGDNAIMIAEAALLHLIAGDWRPDDGRQELKADNNLSLAPR